MKLHDKIPDDLSGKVVIVTGANQGLGFYVTKACAKRGAHVIMACRSEERATKAVADLQEELPDAKLTYLSFDQSSLESIKGFVEEVAQKVDKVDILVNNAGLGGDRKYKTAEGLEFVTGVNHFGCFAVTVALINKGLFSQSDAPRIVITSSEYHRNTFVGNFDQKLKNMEANKGEYTLGSTYQVSKLCNLLMTFKLDRLIKAAGSNIKVVATHPGLTVTHLNNQVFIVRMVGMPLSKGSLSSIVSATVEDVESGAYIGPGGFFNLNGYPKVTNTSSYSKNEDFQDRLWKLSESVTGLTLQL